MNNSRSTDRRTVLKALGAGVVGGTMLTGSAAARGNVVSQINSSGHWAWFPLGQENWGRQKHPYDFREDDSRWMAEPAPGGGVRALAKNITTSKSPPNRNTGFDIHMGPLGDVEKITVESRTVQSSGAGDALLFIGLYLDENRNGEFFKWEKERGDRDRAVPGIFGDEEGLLADTADGTFTIDDDTTFLLLKRGLVPATFGELKEGKIGPYCPGGGGECDEGDKSEGIDGETPSALYIGVADPSPGKGNVEEVVVERVDIQKA